MLPIPKLPMVADNSLFYQKCQRCTGSCPLYGGDDNDCEIFYIALGERLRGTMSHYEEVLNVKDT
jgi:hypothetical protein